MRRICNVWLLALGMTLSMLLPASVFAATIFVDNTLSANITDGTYSIAGRGIGGHDGNAYSTLRAALSAMAAGDIVYLRGGTYHEREIWIYTKTDGTAARPYKVASYTGEWAIVDGQHAGTAVEDQSIITTGAYTAGVSYWTFERLEITGGGTLSPLHKMGAGINGIFKHCVFRHLYIHDNYSSTNAWGAAGGIVMHAPSQDNVVEYCYFRGNGNPTGERYNTNANLVIYSDYKYSAVVDIATASVRNEIRYNLFDSTAAIGWTPVGVAYKGFQRLTGYTHGETNNAADNVPKDGTYRAQGDKIHHNITVGHAQGFKLDQDYVQVYNNIIDVNLNGQSTSSFAGIRTADTGITRRGSFWPAVYNNTVLANGGQAITLPIIKGDWNCSIDGTTCDYSTAFAPNNVIDSADAGYDWQALSINSDASTNCTGAQPHDLTKFVLSRSLIYRAENPTNVFYFERTPYTTAAVVALGAADLAWAKTSPSPFVGAAGSDRYKTRGSYALDATYTISNGGLGDRHPYLDVQIPSYLGAVDPGNSSWVDAVLALASTDTLKRGTTGAPARPTGVIIR